MIINHRYKFIFIKTKKTAGTSIEIALSALCDERDVITEIGGDEVIRQSLGLKGSQNYNIPAKFYEKKDWLKLALLLNPKHFSQHSTAAFVRSNVDDSVWKNYFKFCFERNPFDKAVSRYYWSTKAPRPEIDAYLELAPINLLSNWYLYTINDQIAVDFVGRYESLEDDLAKVARTLGLPKIPELPNAKAHYRLDRRHYSTVVNAQARARIELVCAKEICTFKYVWQGQQDNGLSLMGTHEKHRLGSWRYA